MTGRIIVSVWATLDGFVAGPNDEMDWLRFDQDMIEYERRLVDGADALLLGRVTHADFAAAWPVVADDPNEPEPNRAYARRVCELPKIVVSARGTPADWSGTERIGRLDPGTVDRLKSRFGEVVVYGSLGVVAGLIELGQLDELHLVVHPVLLGTGKQLTTSRLDLHPIGSEPFGSGVVLSRYAVRP